MKDVTANDFFRNYYWVLYYNLTKLPFFTSDEPIVRNITDSYYKVLYPITPKLLIALLPPDMACWFTDGTSSLLKEVIPEGTLVHLRDMCDVSRINAYQFSSCKMHVFSNKNINEIEQITHNSPLIRLIKG
jgi:hypothetical protein